MTHSRKIKKQMSSVNSRKLLAFDIFFSVITADVVEIQGFVLLRV